MKDFETWTLTDEGRAIISAVPLHIAEKIWSAAKISAIDNLAGLIRNGTLVVNQDRSLS
jgi:hypothetical protein